MGRKTFYLMTHLPPKFLLHILDLLQLPVDHSVVPPGGPDRGLALWTLHQLDGLILALGCRGLGDDPFVHRGRVHNVATVCKLYERGVFFILVSKEDRKLFRMTGLAFVRAGVSTQTNTAVSAAEDEVTWPGAGVS